MAVDTELPRRFPCLRQGKCRTASAVLLFGLGLEVKETPLRNRKNWRRVNVLIWGVLVGVAVLQLLSRIVHRSIFLDIPPEMPEFGIS
ncbi:hypothetical protein [Kaistia granuli]|uniref:hypothetical protein n=1 Tax=Kaistia granuli TaxID=363259 RepID=UPI0012EBA574|nr:hypothetical protein [Kaistia granuli]